ncbi:MAG: aspartate--tRNA(Asn) ligase, partial [Thermoprotei archaeon]
YKQMLMTGLTKVYEITPYFRAEKHHTTRHLNESWAIDLEMGFIKGMEDVMEVLEELVCHIIEGVRKECEEEIEILGVEIDSPRRPFARLKYDKVLEILNEEGIHIEWGEDLGDAEERALGKVMKNEGYNLYFITHYPWKTKPFYIMKEDGLSRSFDLDYKGLEISSGGQREHRYEELIKNIREKGLNPKDFEFYLEAFKYGMPPHGGWAVGVERLLMKMLNIDNIRETILFPRDIQRLIP